MESRIKQLREKRGLIQDILATELGITQQMLSKYERDITLIKVDVLKRIAAYFNVTTDYLLGVSDIKRDLQRQMKINGKRLNFRHGYKNPRPHFCNRSTLIIHI